MFIIIDACKYNQVDAIIACDQAVIEYAKNIGVEIHLSTQLNISNSETVKFYSHFADVMVMARELTLEKIKNIYKTIQINGVKGPSGKEVRIELFVHGALCMAISGKCYLSLHEYNASANQGACLQICRRPYIVIDKETKEELEIDNEYIMSPKDLCTIGFLDKIMDAGVRVLKIEGRARSAEYVKTVCLCYSEAINAIIEGNYTKQRIDDWTNRLSKVFNRGFWGGYYLGKKLGDWSDQYGSKATHIKEYIGKGTNYFSNIKVAEFLIETGEIKVGDEILIIGPTTGIIETVISEMHLDNGPVEKATKGQRFSISVNEVVRRSDKLYKLVKNI